MANQYSKNTFKATVEAKYNLPIGQVLYRFQKQGKSLKQVAEATGFKEWTVRRHALQHGCRLTNVFDPKCTKYQSYVDKLYLELRTDKLNRVNVLSRSWTQGK